MRRKHFKRKLLCGCTKCQIIFLQVFHDCLGNTECENKYKNKTWHQYFWICYYSCPEKTLLFLHVLSKLWNTLLTFSMRHDGMKRKLYINSSFFSFQWWNVAGFESLSLFFGAFAQILFVKLDKHLPTQVQMRSRISYKMMLSFTEIQRLFAGSLLWF